MHEFRLKKNEKLCSVTAIDALFSSGGKGSIAFPLRMVWKKRAADSRAGAPVQFLISVPKKKLRHAVDRVTMRRRIREAYRLNRQLMPQSSEDEKFDVAFVYLATELMPYSRIEASMKRLLQKLC